MKKKTTRARHPLPPVTVKPPPVTVAWLTGRFDKLERDHKVIVKLLEGGNVSPGLETAINRTLGIARTIDRKVPD